MPPETYKLSFTTATLRPELARIMAETYLRTRDWKAARSEIIENNLLQAASLNSSKKLESELRLRLTLLTQAQLTLLAHGNFEERIAICWLSMLKRSGLVMEFACEVLRAKLEQFETTLRESDYESFVSEKEVLHPEISRLSRSSFKQVKSRLFTMLREVGILTKGDGFGTLQRILVPPSVAQVIIEDNPVWLKGFLFPDSEIMSTHYLI